MISADTTDKPFRIEKRLVYEAYKAVKSKGGAAGVDGQTIEQFEANLGGNLYKVWNRRPADFRCAHRERPYRADGGQTAD